MSQYQCEWERADSPTAGLSQAAMVEYYKTHSVRGDCRFALRATIVRRNELNSAYIVRESDRPASLLAAWDALLTSIEATGHETAAHRKYRDHLRTQTRAWLWGRPIEIQPLDDSTGAKKKPAPKRTSCPHCGGAL